MLARDEAALELRADPAALAPERLLVLEVDGHIQNFVAAARRAGLELVDEEELEAQGDLKPVAYLLIPDALALVQMESLWRRWQAGQEMEEGFAPWRDVFATLRALRPWGPQDRVTEEDARYLLEELEENAAAVALPVEIELVYRAAGRAGDRAEQEVRAVVEEGRGRVIDRSRIESIAYHALLVELPGYVVHGIAERLAGSIAWLDAVMHVRPQAVSRTTAARDLAPGGEDASPTPTGSPLVAILDGAPVAQHPLLAGRLRVEDLFELESRTLVADRSHGTAMASLVVHGDRNARQTALPRPVVVVPVMVWNGHEEELPGDRLIVDLVYQAVLALRGGDDPRAPDVVVVSLSLGNARRPFHGAMSPWARLLDRMACEFGILFVVSAGNARDRFVVPGFASSTDFEAAPDDGRAAAALQGVTAVAADRRLIAPAEAANALTIGASNEDAVPDHDRRTARVNIDPFPHLRMANPSSRLGPGFANAVKPDGLLPGGREHLRPTASGDGLTVIPAGAARAFGLRVAAPDTGGGPAEGFTSGTSAAAALAARACHRAHDALEAAYGPDFVSLAPGSRALCLKALLVHAARWPDATCDFLVETLGPADPRQHVRRKDNVRRFCGYGFIDEEIVLGCAVDRATCWAVGELGPDQEAAVEMPLPVCLSGVRAPHEVTATLAWFSPPLPGRRSYRTVRLALVDPHDAFAALRVTGASAQPDVNQSGRGTVFSRRWTGDRAPSVAGGDTLRFVVRRQPDQGSPIDELVPFALALTLAMPGAVALYDEVRAQLRVPVRPSAA